MSSRTGIKPGTEQTGKLWLYLSAREVGARKAGLWNGDGAAETDGMGVQPEVRSRPGVCTLITQITV